ncbi:MAG: VOC family protein [Ferruginibacter sp.]
MKKLFYVFVFSMLCVITTVKMYSQAIEGKIKPALNHIATYVVDLKISTAFYQNVIQLDTIPEPFHDGRHTWFSIGPKSHLHLIQGAKEFSSHEKNNHLCFSVSSVNAFIKNLEKHTIEYENWAGQKMQVTKRVDGVNQIYLKDPDGYWIEINDAKF